MVSRATVPDFCIGKVDAGLRWLGVVLLFQSPWCSVDLFLHIRHGGAFLVQVIYCMGLVPSTQLPVKTDHPRGVEVASVGR